MSCRWFQTLLLSLGVVIATGCGDDVGRSDHPVDAKETSGEGHASPIPVPIDPAGKKPDGSVKAEASKLDPTSAKPLEPLAPPQPRKLTPAEAAEIAIKKAQGTATKSEIEDLRRHIEAGGD